MKTPSLAYLTLMAIVDGIEFHLNAMDTEIQSMAKYASINESLLSDWEREDVSMRLVDLGRQLESHVEEYERDAEKENGEQVREQEDEG